MRRLLPLALLALSTACYHAVVDTGRPMSSKVVMKPWANSFIGGLIPPAPVATKSACPNGVAKVETQMSFLNLIVGGITGGIYTPMTIKVTCAR
jgi:hypothetical protein